jgi:hypothetical protein
MSVAVRTEAAQIASSPGSLEVKEPVAPVAGPERASAHAVAATSTMRRRASTAAFYLPGRSRDKFASDS